MRVVKIFVLLVIILYVAFVVDKYFFNAKPFVEIAGQRLEVSIADQREEWIQGLSGTEEQAMLFIFPDKEPRTFWMKDMNYAIDIVWLDGDRVVGVVKNVEPALPGTLDRDLVLYNSPEAVDRVLEIPVDFVENLSLNIKVGDSLNINI